MSVTAEPILRLDYPGETAAELGALNTRLARERRVPAEVAAMVHDLAGWLTETDLARWEAIDPYLALLVHRGVIEAQEALATRAAGQARDRLRVALETLRQAFSAIAEGEPVGDERSPKEVVQWLADATEVPQPRLARLLGVSVRQLQRWLSEATESAPEGDDARRARAVARIVNQLRFALTPAGTVDWFDWPRSDLGGERPRDLLDDPRRLPELTMLAGAMRSTYAA